MTNKWDVPLGEARPIGSASLAYDEMGALHLTCMPEGGGIVFEGSPGRVGGPTWTEDRYIVFDATDEQEWSVRFSLLFWLDGNESDDPADADMVISTGLLPRIKTRIAIPLSALDSQRWFLARTPGRRKTVVHSNRIDVHRVCRFGIHLPSCFGRQRLTIGDLHLTNLEPEYPLPDVILVDELGQYDRRDWPGKTYGPEKLVAYLKKEASLQEDVPQMADRSSYGGWLEKRFKATGFFRTERDERRWWLVDPEGYAFYSLGFDQVQPGQPAYVHGIEKFFAWLPEEAEYVQFWSRLADIPGTWHFMQQLTGDERFFNFAGANLYRAFGDDWWKNWARITRRRHIEWGVNTIGNWSELRFIRWARMPYVWPLADFPRTRTMVFRDFSDVFSQEYRDNARSFAQQLGDFVGDPFLVGYFLRNEPTWAFVRRLNLAHEVLCHEADLSCKEALLTFLAEHYSGDVTRLNEAWGMNLAAFEELRRPMDRGLELSPAAEKDLRAFSEMLVTEYVRVPSEACREVDPQHMNLGMRWAYIHDPLLISGYKHFDVFSINCYRMNPAEEIARVAELTDKPVLIGEFHFGALGRGMTSTGLRAVTSQAERGVAWRYYVESAAAMPHSVGVHYFILNDQPVLGRLDGENYQIGAVDVCHRPYTEFVREIQNTNRTIYEIAAALRTSGSAAPVEIERCG